MTLVVAVYKLVKLASISAFKVTGSNLSNYLIISDKLVKPSDAAVFEVNLAIIPPSPKGMHT